MSKAKRKGRIFIDWLRNQRGATAVLPYVVRARELASVAAPVTWEELDGIESAAHFTVKDAALLLDRASSRDLRGWGEAHRSEEHTSELQSLMRISYAVFCLKKKQ